MDATPTFDFYLNIIFSFNCYSLLHDEQMYDAPSRCGKYKSTFLNCQELIIEQVAQGNEGIQVLDSQ